MTLAYDAIVVGAGLSGLSLAAHLAASPRAARRVLVVDDGSHDLTERAWGFWARDPGWVFPAVHASWGSMAVHAAGRLQVSQLAPYRYFAVRGAAFAGLVDGVLARAPGVVLRSGHVAAVREESGGASVEVDGVRVDARWVFDSRRPQAHDGPHLSFLGREVESETDAFTPAQMTFMDFRAGRPGRLAFAYVLPLTARRALVEVADIGWQHADHLADDLDDYVRTCLGIDHWSVVRTEAARIPLTPQVPTGRGHVVPIGRRAGMLKPSTGYAFTRIQRHSAALCLSLAERGHPYVQPGSGRRHSWLDTVLLEVARRDPDAIESAFGAMFARNSVSSILRFLDEDATPAQEARLIATLPPAAFVRAAVSVRRS